MVFVRPFFVLRRGQESIVNASISYNPGPLQLGVLFLVFVGYLLQMLSFV